MKKNKVPQAPPRVFITNIDTLTISGRQFVEEIRFATIKEHFVKNDKIKALLTIIDHLAPNPINPINPINTKIIIKPFARAIDQE